MKEKLGQETAFPYSDVTGTTGNYPSGSFGMSKRFYAACAAMQGILSGAYSNADMLDGFNKVANANSVKTQEYIIERAYLFADELLKQEGE